MTRESHRRFVPSLTPCLPPGLLVVALVLLAPSGCAHAADPAADLAGITIAGCDTLACEPGSQASCVVTVHAEGSVGGLLFDSVRCPEGWQCVLGTGILDLGRSASVRRILVFHSRPDLRPGVYPLVYRIMDDGPEHTIHAIVQRRDEILLELPRHPGRIIPGRGIELAAVFVNRGNTDRSLVLTAAARDGWTATVGEGRIVLQPGETRTVPVTIGAPAALDRPTRSWVRVQAVDPQTHGAPVTAETHVEALPRRTVGSSTWRTFPLEIRPVAGLFDGGAQLSGDCAGRGALDTGGRYRLDLLLRGPDTRGQGPLGAYDAYSAALEGPGLSILAGDGPYALTPLTRGGLRSRGVSIEANLPPGLRAGAFLVSEPGTGRRREVSSFLGSRPGGRGSWRLGILGKPSLARPGDPDLWIGWVEIARTLAGRLSGAVEIATNLPRAAEGEAWRAVLERSDRELGFRIEGIRAGRAFDGAHRDQEFAAAALNKSLGGDLEARGTATHQSRRVFDGSGAVDGWERRARLEVRHGRGAGVSLDLAGLAAELNTGLPTHDWREQSLRAAARLSGAAGSLAATAEAGRRSPENAAAPQRIERLTVSTRLKLGAGAAIDLTAGRSRHGAAQSIRDMGQVLITARDGSRLQLDLRALVSSFRSAPASLYRQADLTCRARIHGRLYLTAQVRAWRVSDQDWRRAALVGLAQSFDVPFARSGRSADLTGRAIRDGSMDESGVPDLIVNLDDASSVTDDRGRFQFRGFPPGEHYLDISTPGPGWIAVGDWPRPVTLVEDDPQDLRIVIARVASVAGRVVLGAARQDTTRGDLFVEGSGRTNVAGPEPRSAGLPGVTLTLIGGGYRRRCLTDASGAFRFDGLAPGTWTIELDVGTIPAMHEADRASRTIVLLQGETVEIGFTVSPIRRAVRMIERGSLESDR